MFHFPQPSLETRIAVSKIADKYGLDVWGWYPAMDKGYDKPDVVDKAVAEWAEIMSARRILLAVSTGDPLCDCRRLNGRRSPASGIIRAWRSTSPVRQP